eukprot:CAMPEP_0198113132 /NCGR_PEP_ID=MMETSP1442-20131203/4875_1 /TAXON_ID= /ORGANISM="Craspedostauros australis, Strain CCMP3328" /LENGTH=445 /DNA_ID=CAMNT_0043770141 /DNA_START=45 /DNA_END=1382 /DNA_ORIENTATION=+
MRLTNSKSIAAAAAWLVLVRQSHAYSSSVQLPLFPHTRSSTPQESAVAVAPAVGSSHAVANDLVRTFVQSNAQFLKEDCVIADEANEWICPMPIFGDDARVRFELISSGHSNGNSNGNSNGSDDDTRRDGTFIRFHVEDVLDQQDFGWICSKLYDCTASINGVTAGTAVQSNPSAAIDFQQLRAVVAGYCNAKPPHPGYDASRWQHSEIHNIANYVDASTILQQLKSQGFITIDLPKYRITPQQHEQLSAFLQHKTNQGASVRTDTVHFLNYEQSQQAGIADQFELLLSIASYLNDLQFAWVQPQHNPIPPATPAAPHTVPNEIQIAEYGYEEFYKPHSDNSLQAQDLRSNFRAVTGILYCNDDWDLPTMGGALRIWPQGRDHPVRSPDPARYVDVEPRNGRLLLFDSCLLHSVEPVTTREQTRRALTVWINRPDDSGVKGETYY